MYVCSVTLTTLCAFRLQEEYPLWFEKPVLEMVHHNTVSLDKLVEMAWVEILTKYAVGEECDFLVSLDFFKIYFNQYCAFSGWIICISRNNLLNRYCKVYDSFVLFIFTVNHSHL